MTKDVLLSIVGLYSEDDGTVNNKDTLEMLTLAECYKKDDTYYVFYEEILDGVSGVTKCRLKFSSKSFELTRRGEVTTQMLFEENKKTLNSYQMPYGVLTMGLDTKTILIEESDTEIKIHIEYSMEVDYQKISDNEINIIIKATGCQ